MDRGVGEMSDCNGQDCCKLSIIVITGEFIGILFIGGIFQEEYKLCFQSSEFLSPF